MDRPIYLLSLTPKTPARSVSRVEVGGNAVETARSLLGVVLAGSSPPPVPGLAPPSVLTLVGAGSCATLTLRATGLGGRILRAAPTIELSIARRSRCGAKLWRMLHPNGTDKPCPPEPWMLAHVDGEFGVGDPWQSLDELLHAFAWAFIEVGSEGKKHAA